VAADHRGSGWPGAGHRKSQPPTFVSDSGGHADRTIGREPALSTGADTPMARMLILVWVDRALGCCGGAAGLGVARRPRQVSTGGAGYGALGRLPAANSPPMIQREDVRRSVAVSSRPRWSNRRGRCAYGRRTRSTRRCQDNGTEPPQIAIRAPSEAASSPPPVPGPDGPDLRCAVATSAIPILGGRRLVLFAPLRFTLYVPPSWSRPVMPWEASVSATKVTCLDTVEVTMAGLRFRRRFALSLTAKPGLDRARL